MVVSNRSSTGNMLESYNRTLSPFLVLHPLAFRGILLRFSRLRRGTRVTGAATIIARLGVSD